MKVLLLIIKGIVTYAGQPVELNLNVVVTPANYSPSEPKKPERNGEKEDS